jgi:hypothetical protein
MLAMMPGPVEACPTTHQCEPLADGSGGEGSCVQGAEDTSLAPRVCQWAARLGSAGPFPLPGPAMQPPRPRPRRPGFWRALDPWLGQAVDVEQPPEGRLPVTTPDVTILLRPIGGRAIVNIDLRRQAVREMLEEAPIDAERDDMTPPELAAGAGMIAAGEAAGQLFDGDVALLAAMYRALAWDATGAAESLEPPAMSRRHGQQEGSGSAEPPEGEPGRELWHGR